jgi:FtsP/CotA-like multicopper oxidase with cupredoxin domain
MNTQRKTRLACGVRALAAAALTLAAAAAAAKIDGVTGTQFTLVAKAGYISAADGGSIYNWGYALRTASGEQMQYPGPTLIVNEGDRVEVTLINELPTNVSIIFPGQDDVIATEFTNLNRPTGCIGGPPSERSALWGTASAGNAVGNLVREARPRGCVKYSFIASRPGTYMYHSGTQMGVQVEMGLFGALIVRPSGAPGQAYDHPGTRFDREHLLVLSEIDPVWHEEVRRQAEAVVLPSTNGTFKWSVNTAGFPARNPLYWFINGRTAPDTMTEPFAPHLPAQPYNALPRMHPGERLLLRMVNAGRDLHPFHHHGNNTWTIAVDGRMLASSPAAGPDLARSDNTLRMIPGQTVDAIYQWTGAGLGWDIYGIQCDNTLPAANPASCDAVYANLDPRMRHQLPSDRGRPLPTALPSTLELTFGDMYSGSPFLGRSGEVPVGAGKLAAGGAYYHMFHSHNEREIINNGVFPGGMMTMVVIEPWNVEID